MTTILVDIRTEPRLYADSLAESCGVSFEATKLAVVDKTLAIGWSGSFNRGQQFATFLREWRETHPEKPFRFPNILDKFEIPEAEKERFIVLALRKIEEQGTRYAIYQLYEDLVPTRIHQPFFAIGSGAHFALGALAHGASAFEALEIAAVYDKHTGSPFYSETL